MPETDTEREARHRDDAGPESRLEPAETPARQGRGLFEKLWLGLLVILVVWLAGAGLVLWWQPGRFMQAGIVAVCIVAALLIPRRHIDRILSAFAVLILIAALFYVPSYLLTREVEFTIRSTDRDSSREIYLVHTDRGAKSADEPGETFKNVDAPLLYKVNSSDVQGQAEALKGRRVRARVYGFRVTDLSEYRNIIWIEPVEGS
jgi:hypothetical protein